ncbi:MAG: hypothetical protein WBD86_01265 [Microgenomates group bacterium]
MGDEVFAPKKARYIIGSVFVVVLCCLLIVLVVVLFSLWRKLDTTVVNKQITAPEAAALSVAPTPKTEPMESSKIAVSAVGGGEVFLSPVEIADVFNDESAWLIAEPGVILDDTAAWVIPSVDAVHFANVPEGGFTYFSFGEGVITVDGVSLVLPGREGLNYLVLIRGRIDDTIVDSDLNITVEVSDFVPGHAIWSIMPPGAYVSKGWFMQQLVTSTTTGGTNCGATGCTTVHVVLFDVDSHFYQKFEVKANDLDNWKLLESN